jgi:hypothetical protein
MSKPPICGQPTAVLGAGCWRDGKEAGSWKQKARKPESQKAQRGAEAPLLILMCALFLLFRRLLLLFYRFVVAFIAVNDPSWNQEQTYFFGC